MSPYDHTLKGKKSDKDEIRIRLALGALMGLFGPKGGAQGGAQGSPPKGLYKQTKGAPKTLILAVLLFAWTVTIATVAVHEQHRV